MLNDTDFALLTSITRIYRQEETLSLSQLADRLDKSPSYLSERLGKLADEGWVHRQPTRTAEGRTVNFAPAEGLMVRWVSPHQGVAREWKCIGEIDWRYPLVSQVPDGKARDTLVAFLARLREKDLLDPHALSEADLPDDTGEDLFHLGLSIIVYGSCARGQAQPGSDVDVIVVQAASQVPDPEEADTNAITVTDEVRDIASEVGLETPRPLQVTVESVDTVHDLPGHIQRALASEGLVVYDGLRTKPGGKPMGIWEFLEGLRDDEG